MTEITANSGGIISFQTVSHSASEIVGSLFGPIFAKIDPEEVGSRARAMRIGEDYGVRLNQRFENLRPEALSLLTQSYTSHGFVIDMSEAEALFHRVRESSEEEKALTEEIGKRCRMPERKVHLENVTEQYKKISTKETENENRNEQKKGTAKSRAQNRKSSRRGVNGGDSSTAGAA